MKELREYSFGDWFSIFLKAWPAFLLVQLLIAVVIAVPLMMVWSFWRAP